MASFSPCDQFLLAGSQRHYQQHQQGTLNAQLGQPLNLLHGSETQLVRGINLMLAQRPAPACHTQGKNN